jgi:hypothetical protein
MLKSGPQQEKVEIMNTLKRYLGNTNTTEVHDTARESTNCELDAIKIAHRQWYDTLAEAKADRSYDNCAWCLGGSTR